MSDPDLEPAIGPTQAQTDSHAPRPDTSVDGPIQPFHPGRTGVPRGDIGYTRHLTLELLEDRRVTSAVEFKT